jgi:diamine N-acetyltransferase
MMITRITTDSQLRACVEVIRNAFRTVADDLGLDMRSAPTHPSFITFETVKQSAEKGVASFGLFVEEKLAGCIALEKSGEEGVFFVERLAVLPEYRYNGLGGRLLEYAAEQVKNSAGKKISIGIINEQQTLKQWYGRHGFSEKECRTFEHQPFTVCFMEREIV